MNSFWKLVVVLVIFSLVVYLWGAAFNHTWDILNWCEVDSFFEVWMTGSLLIIFFRDLS